MKHLTTAQRITDLLNKNRMTAKTLSEKTGIGKSSISHYIHGTHVPGSMSALKIAYTFNVNPAYIMGLTDDPTPVSNNPIIKDLKKEDTLSNSKAYYLDDEAQEAAQFLYENPEYKVLFDATRKVKKEDIEFVKHMIDKLSN